jgi:mannosyl-oligosaccharide glucosidase
MDIITHWAALIDENGWIAREQILGDEARSKVPKEFQPQKPHFANPPTLVWALEKISQKASIRLYESTVDKSEQIAIFLKKVLPKFKLNYEWFKKTQYGHIKSWNYNFQDLVAFKWRGRSGHHILTSGLDDYPRSSPGHLGDLHIDLQCWMIYFARTMRNLASDDETYEYFKTEQQKMERSLGIVLTN